MQEVNKIDILLLKIREGKLCDDKHCNINKYSTMFGYLLICTAIPNHEWLSEKQNNQSTSFLFRYMYVCCLFADYDHSVELTVHGGINLKGIFNIPQGFHQR